MSRPATARPMSKHIPSISSFSYANPDNNRPRTGQSRPATAGRPWTAQSRPTTARPQTAASTRYEGSYVIALLEGRGIAREVGMAAIDLDLGRVVLVQVRSRSSTICFES